MFSLKVWKEILGRVMQQFEGSMEAKNKGNSEEKESCKSEGPEGEARLWQELFFGNSTNPLIKEYWWSEYNEAHRARKEKRRQAPNEAPVTVNPIPNRIKEII